MPEHLFVLIVEDDPTNRMLATRILSAAGMRYAEVTDGERALEWFSENTPDLVLMDLSLPGIDGWEVTRRLRRKPELHALPILAVSAHAMSGDRERALAAGCNDYLTKPYRPAELTSAIARVLESTRERTETPEEPPNPMETMVGTAYSSEGTRE